MSKRRKKPRNTKTSPPRQQPARSKTRRWLGASRFIVAVVVLVGAVGSGLAVFKHNYEISHDLSVIGKGIPTVVQIHDTNCSLCNQLRRNADSAIGHFGDRLLYRIADISTPAGRRLQQQHDVPHVTLLLFDGEGQLRNVLTGVKSDDLLRRSFEIHLKRWG